MSATITDVAAALGVPAVDIAEILRSLSDVDLGDTIDPEPTVAQGDVIECADGSTYPNVHLTPAAVTSLFAEFRFDPTAFCDKFDVVVRMRFRVETDYTIGGLQAVLTEAGVPVLEPAGQSGRLGVEAVVFATPAEMDRIATRLRAASHRVYVTQPRG